MDLGLRGRRALVMGASRGLGRACAEALAREGVAVTIVARDAVIRLAAPNSAAAARDEPRRGGQEKLAAQGFLPKGSTAPEFAAYVRDEVAKYAKIVKDANIKVD